VVLVKSLVSAMLFELDVHFEAVSLASYSACTPPAVLCLAEAEKKRKYSQACHDRRATFTPFVSQ